MDRRILKTRRDIRKACIELIEEKGFEAMTVLDIAERANINRGTFYLHYVDKFDLLDKYEDELFEKIQAVIDRNIVNMETIEQLLISRYPTLVQLFECLYTEQELLQVVLNTKGIFSIQERIKAFFVEFINEKVLSKLPTVTLHYPLEFFGLYIASMYIAILQYWLQQNMKQTPEQLAKMMMDLIFHGSVKAMGFIPPKDINIEQLLHE